MLRYCIFHESQRNCFLRSHRVLEISVPLLAWSELSSDFICLFLLDNMKFARVLIPFFFDSMGFAREDAVHGAIFSTNAERAMEFVLSPPEKKVQFISGMEALQAMGFSRVCSLSFLAERFSLPLQAQSREAMAKNNNDVNRSMD